MISKPTNSSLSSSAILFCSTLKKPWLFLPAPFAHKLAAVALPIAAQFGKWAYGHSKQQVTPVWKSLQWQNILFKNPLGVAGGVDKEGSQLIHWENLGDGFMEVGTVTPKPQSANPGIIIGRDNLQKALWNKMGFPNLGIQALKDNLNSLEGKINFPLFINIGKNRDTKNEDAIHDYIYCVRELAKVKLANIFVINISSPNTKGLRDLQTKESVSELLKSVRQTAGFEKKLLLKLSPDLNEHELKNILDVCLNDGADGVVLTNTTLQRPIDLPFSTEEGGISGEPLKKISRDFLIKTVSHVRGDENKNKHFLIVSVGGVTDLNEVQWRLNQGADLVETYSALIFDGPFFFKKAANYQWQ